MAHWYISCGHPGHCHCETALRWGEVRILPFDEKRKQNQLYGGITIGFLIAILVVVILVIVIIKIK